jgi:hypothetical protein
LTQVNGETPLFAAANLDRDRCVELLLADERVDVSLASNDGMTPLISASIQLMKSMDRVGATDGKDPARCLVLMLKSRRIPIQNLAHSIAGLRPFLPNRRDVTVAEAGGAPLTQTQKTARLVVPVLEAQLKGERRGCAYCLKLTPDVNLDLCGGCKQVGYCQQYVLEEMALPDQTPCHVKHWKDGHKKECARFQEEEEEKKKEAEAAGGGGAGGGGGGGSKKKKGKGKKGRRR